MTTGTLILSGKQYKMSSMATMVKQYMCRVCDWR